MLQLKPFQIEGANFLAARTRALLACEPGTGKTAQVVTAAKQLKARTVRVVCPAVGIEHWKREFQRWGKSYKPQLEILSYDAARTMARGAAQNGIISLVDILVLDECHYAKNPDAARTLAVFGKGGLGWFAKRIWALSGTPMLRHAGELWPLLRSFGATKLDYEAFKQRFCIVDAMGKVRGNRAEAMPELRGMMKVFALRRLKKDVLSELGPIDVQDWYVAPSADFITDPGMEEAARQGERELRRGIKNLPPDELLAFLAGHQEFATVRRYNALLKVPAVFAQAMHDIEAGLLDKLVLYGYHKEPLEILEREFNKAKVGAVLIHGGTPQKDRDRLVQEWKYPNGPRVMCASIIAAGTVLDFSVAHQGIMLEMDWNDSTNQQAMQRMHRQGQTQPVTIRVAIGSSIDEVISNVFSRKARDFATLFNGAAWGQTVPREGMPAPSETAG